MALQKEIETRYGVSGNYLRITNIDIKAKIIQMDIRLDVYKDKAARDAGKQPLDSKTVIVNGQKFIQYASGLTKGGSLYDEIATVCYNHLKTLPAFADSSDV